MGNQISIYLNKEKCIETKCWEKKIKAGSLVKLCNKESIAITVGQPLVCRKGENTLVLVT